VDKQLKTKFMQKIILLFLLLPAAFQLHAQNWNEKEPWSKQLLNKDALQHVELITLGGNISVSGVDAAEARIEVYVYPNNRRDNESYTKSQIEERLKNYDLRIEVSNHKLTASARPKDKNLDWREALSISFKVFVPQQVSCQLSSSGGNINLINLSGTQDFRTSGGNLYVDRLSGIIKGRTSGGNIHVKNTRDFIDLSTSGGSINANNCMGTVTLITSGGSLNLNSLQGIIKASTSGGSIQGGQIAGELKTHTSGGSIKLTALSCSLEASTSAGKMEIAIIKPGEYIRLSNYGGNIDLQLPADAKMNMQVNAQRIESNTLSNFNGTMNREEVSGKMNGGGMPVTVRAQSGRVSLMVR
jgi:DUF4097 and DUF4098 domain-containing protein YvlB